MTEKSIGVVSTIFLRRSINYFSSAILQLIVYQYFCVFIELTSILLAAELINEYRQKVLLPRIPFPLGSPSGEVGFYKLIFGWHRKAVSISFLCFGWLDNINRKKYLTIFSGMFVIINNSSFDF